MPSSPLGPLPALGGVGAVAVGGAAAATASPIPEAVACAAWGAFLVVLASIDVATLRLSNRLIYPALPLGVAWTTLIDGQHLVGALAAGALAMLPFLVLFLRPWRRIPVATIFVPRTLNSDRRGNRGRGGISC